MDEVSRIIFFGMNILINKSWEKDQAVIVEGGVIQAIIPVGMIKHHLPAIKYEFAEDDYLVPGFIDMHIHGAGGFDVMDASVDALNNISKLLAEEGVTGFLATTMTAADEKIEAALAVIPEAIKSSDGAAILGVHLEGPFVSREKMGAQDGTKVREPDIDLFKHWQKIADGNIKLVTVAPELNNALPFIQALRAMDVISAIGHTDATYEEAMAAVATGSTYATHLFNAMRPLRQREPGTVGALLLANEVTGELIADGKHLHPAIYELALRMKGKDKLLLVTDAMRAKCMRDGHYELGGQTVSVVDGKATLADGTLAGSVLTMPDAIKNFMKFTNSKLEDVIHMVSHNPAQKLKISTKKGSIEVGKDADLVVLNKDVEVKMTMRGGKVVFEK